MAYFNHAFQKMFFAGGATGYINNAGDDSVDLYGLYGSGAVTFADHNATGWPSVVAASAPVVAGAPLTLLATSLYQNDKIGPFHGGYQETTKSKMVNPKYISRFYKVQAKLPVNNIIAVGGTDFAPQCCPDFYCDETYQLRLDLKGSPALRFLNHNIYEIACAYTGCCDGPVPELVDPALVMQTWMQYVADDPILFGLYGQTNQRFVNVGFIVSCDGGDWDLYLPDNVIPGQPGVYFEADGTTPNAVAIAFRDALVNAADNPLTLPNDPIASSSYTSVFNPNANNCCAGLVIEAAYEDTKFGDCTFQTSDFFETEPIRIQASVLDDTGDPCVFEQLCIHDGITPSGVGSTVVLPALQTAVQVMGTGEQVLRDLILSESYGQNWFNTNDANLRIREITQGYDVTGAVNRSGLYTCYFILHTVPRMNNPTGVFDNDQYLLSIPILDLAATGVGSAAFEAFMVAWLAGAGSTVALETF